VVPGEPPTALAVTVDDRPERARHGVPHRSAEALPGVLVGVWHDPSVTEISRIAQRCRDAREETSVTLRERVVDARRRRSACYI